MNSCWKHKCHQDVTKVFPAKLSKKELEDQYYKLNEENMDLKKAAHELRESIKILKTKLLRITSSTHNCVSGRNNCCSKSQEIIRLHKKEIADLEISNQQMEEKINLLNLQLCSKKQYLQPFPSHISLKPVRSDPHLIAKKTKKDLDKNKTFRKASSAREHSQNLNKIEICCEELAIVDADENTAVQNNELKTDVREEEQVTTKLETSMVEDLKQKIISLEEELKQVKNAHESQIKTLKEQIESLEIQKQSVAETTKSIYTKRLAECDNRNRELNEQLREAFIKHESLLNEVTLEKGKAEELRIQLKAAEINRNVATSMDEYFQSLKLRNSEKFDATSSVDEETQQPLSSDRKNIYDIELKNLREENERLAIKVTFLQTQIDEIRSRDNDKIPTTLCPSPPTDVTPPEKSDEDILPNQATDNIIIPSKYKPDAQTNSNAIEMILEQAEKDKESENIMSQDRITKKEVEQVIEEIKSNSPKASSNSTENKKTRTLDKVVNNGAEKTGLRVCNKNENIEGLCEEKDLKFKTVNIFRGKFKEKNFKQTLPSNMKAVSASNPKPQRIRDIQRSKKVSEATSSDTDLDVSSLPEEDLRQESLHDEDYISESSYDCHSGCRGDSDMLMLSEGEIPRCHFGRRDSFDKPQFTVDHISERYLKMDEIPPKFGDALKALNGEVLKCKQLIKNAVIDSKLRK